MNLPVSLILSTIDGNRFDRDVVSSSSIFCISVGTAHVVGCTRNLIKYKFVREKIMNCICQRFLRFALRSDLIEVLRDFFEYFFFQCFSRIFLNRMNEKRTEKIIYSFKLTLQKHIIRRNSQ
jgi:hypothetical protein